MKCISVYTNDFELFSDIFEKIMSTPLEENEEKDFDGVTVSESGEVPQSYIDRMRAKREVVVMKDRVKNIIILQHGKVFEIIIPSEDNVLH